MCICRPRQKLASPGFPWQNFGLLQKIRSVASKCLSHCFVQQDNIHKWTPLYDYFKLKFNARCKKLTWGYKTNYTTVAWHHRCHHNKAVNPYSVWWRSVVWFSHLLVTVFFKTRKGKIYVWGIYWCFYAVEQNAESHKQTLFQASNQELIKITHWFRRRGNCKCKNVN